jgi:hypothetical protein
MERTGVGAVTVAGGVKTWMGDDSGVLRRVDGKMLETEDIVESVGDDGDGNSDGGVNGD